MDKLKTPELVDHILATYHAAHRRDVPALIEAARKVERIHRGKPAVPVGLADVLEDLWLELQQHMTKEEELLFPMLRAGAHGSQVYMPMRVLEHEHEEHAVQLARIRQLTGNLLVPPHACETWAALYRGLLALENQVMEHMRLENNVLFPRSAAQIT